LLVRVNFMRAAPSRATVEPSSQPEPSRELLAAASMSEAEVLDLVNARLEGLDEEEALARLAAFGPNVVGRNGAPSLAREFWDRAKNPLNLLLLSLAALSYLLGDLHSAIIISVIVAIAILMAFVQEHRSNAAAAKLKAMIKLSANVRRRDTGGFRDRGSEILVRGDIVRLSAGDMIPADLRLLDVKDLCVDQSTLTGEAMPCEKSATLGAEVVVNPFDARNLALMGASVVSGFGVGVVLRTGAETYFGRLADKLSGGRERTSFDEGVNRFIWLMIRFMLVLAPLVFLVNGATKGDWPDALLFGLAVAVGLTPELLPMIVTVNLAKGAIAMSRKSVIVKRLNAIQNFGAMDVLCTDKTGTLTENRIVLSLHLDLQGKTSRKTLQYAYLNSRHQSGLKSLLDGAVLRHVEEHGGLDLAQDYRCVDEIPFDFNRRRLSVILEEVGTAPERKLAGLLQRLSGETNEARLLICKGAVEEVVSACGFCEIDGRRRKLSVAHRYLVLKKARALNEDGLRVLAVAYREFPVAKARYAVSDESALTLLGFIAFLDPPKQSVGSTLAALKASGVTVKILTGDNDVVTRKICRDIGLDINRLAIGSEIEAMSDAELSEACETISVFAKTAPEQKARVIAALHAKGHVVGFLGDGVNDSLALRAADVGVSVDTAADIAKESADIILLEKSLMVLHQGIVEGRKVFGNIVKYIRMGASSNFGSMFSVLGASVLLPFLPMLPIQVLANNLLYDFSQTAIPSDDVDPEYLAAPRKWDIGNIFKFMVFIGPISSIFDYTTFYVMIHVFDGWSNPSLFQTGWFVESLLTQTLIIHVIRTDKIPFVQSIASPTLIGASLVVSLTGVLLPYTEIGRILEFTPLPAAYWPILAATLCCYGALTQAVKTWFVWRYTQ